MVRRLPSIKLFLVLVTVMLSAATMAPSLPIVSSDKDVQEEDSAARVERSTNLSRITGTGSKIRMYIKEKYLQLFIDGTVNATDDEESIYTILQRTSVNRGLVKIQGAATCTFLCMDSCGLLYSTREFGDECIFNENLEKHYYNVYSSTKYSDSKRTLYVAISKYGKPRKVEIKTNALLGKLSSSTTVLPQPVDHHSIMELENRLLAMHPKSAHHSLRHHQLCPPPHHTKVTISVKCRKQQKKKKRKKHNEEEMEDTSPAKKRYDEDGDSIIVKKSKKKKTEKKFKSKSIASKSAERDEDVPTTAIAETEIEDGFLEEEN